MSETPILGLTEVAEAQADREIPINEAFRWLEFFAAGFIKSRALTAPPGSPQDGDAYIPASTSTGDWVGQEDKVALRMGTAWKFKTPPVGVILYVDVEDANIQWKGSTDLWVAFP